MYYGMAISSVILDVLILVMPLPLIWRLQMSVKDKVAVSGIFLLGSLFVSQCLTLHSVSETNLFSIVSRLLVSPKQ